MKRANRVTKPTKAQPAKTTPRPLSRRRLWLFRFTAAILLPLLLFGALELMLRVAGYGYPTSFFVRTQINGEEFYVPNDRFGFRFFPPEIARTPYAIRVRAQKPANTYRIFLFGESAAQGDPDPTFGMGRYLEVLLRERYPDRQFEVVCVAMTAINSHAILPIARECARLDGDLWVVYMGNNEMVGPYGAGTIFGPQSPRLSLIRASLAVKATKTGQLLEQLLGRMGASASAQKSWGGMNMFKNQQLRSNDPSRLRTYDNFAGNLEAILQAGRKAGVPVILSTIASNLKDCPPFASLHRSDLGESQKADWERYFNAGVMLEKNGHMDAALKFYARAAAIDPEFAELHFRKATCELALTNATVARSGFQLARDNDALAFRADTRINQIIIRSAERQARDSVILVNADEALATSLPEGILGEELFYEHVHLNFAGNYRLAKLVAEKIVRQLPAAISSRGKPEWASAEFCDRRLAVSLWDRHRVWQANFSRVSEKPFTEQLNDVPRAKRYLARLEQFRSQMNEEAQQQARTMYREALAAAPDDPGLRGNYAQVLGEFGDFAAAGKEQERVCELLPQSPAAFYKAGVLLVRQNVMDRAAEQFKHALALRADYVPALNELGLILANQQKVAEAEQCFLNAIQINPGYMESHINLGFTKQSGGGQMAEALSQYQLAARLQPEGPAAYFSKGVASASERRSADAVKLFQTAVWMNPSFWQARYLLGVELAANNQTAEAEQQFAEVVRLRPDFAKGRVNFGVALAKRKQFGEAAVEFRAALKLNPTNETALRNLQMIQSLQGQQP
jgi:tetratricopeptide (TPR) repeat protein